MRTIVRIVLLLLSSCLIFAQSASPNTSPSFSLSLKAPESVKAGSNVVLEITLTNIADHQIFIPHFLGGGELNYDIWVRDSTGKLAQETVTGKKIHNHTNRITGSGSIVLRQLDPGKTVVSSADLTTVYELTQPGNYSVQVQRMDQSTHVLVKSNQISITVVQ